MAFTYATTGTTPKIYPSSQATNPTPSPAYSGTFIPTIWSGKLIEKFYASTVLAAISNTDYQGEIKNQGDTVRIRQVPTITINNYLIDGELLIERPAKATVDLVIDKAKYFNLILDDVMEVQADINLMNVWSDDAAQQFKIVVDQDVLVGIIGQAAAANKGPNAGALSGNINLGQAASGVTLVSKSPTAGQIEVMEMIVRMGQVLDEQNIPETGRWLVVPAIFAAKIKMSELRDASLTGDNTSILRNGRLGVIDRFTIYVSNLLPPPASNGLSAGEYFIYAGTQHALTFASQINKVETMRSEHTFGQILRGLQVYGYKVLDGNALVQAVVKFA